MQKQELIRIIMDYLEPFIGGKLTKKWNKETNEYSLMLNSHTEILKTTKVASFIDALMGIYNWEMFKRNNPEQQSVHYEQVCDVGAGVCVRV